ncbi:hypothetical protein HKD37_09G025252 [Glycine soja]
MEDGMEAMKEQMAAMMEAMISMKKIMEANAVAIAATSVVAKVNPTSPSGINQMNHPTSYMVGKDLGSTGGPHDVQIKNEHAFPPYGLPLNYTPPNVAYTPNKNVNNSTPIPIESQQPQTDHAHGKQLVVYPYKTLWKVLSITHNYHLLHSTTSKNPHAMAEMGKLDHLEERLRAIEGAKKKPVEFTQIPVSYVDLVPCPLDNAVVAINPARALKRKVQGLIDAGWLKFEENRV